MEDMNLFWFVCHLLVHFFCLFLGGKVWGESGGSGVVFSSSFFLCMKDSSFLIRQAIVHYIKDVMKFLLDPTKTMWRVTVNPEKVSSEVFLFQGTKHQPQHHGFSSHIRITWGQQQLCYSGFKWTEQPSTPEVPRSYKQLQRSFFLHHLPA